MMKKIILLMMVSLILISSVYALNYPLASNEWGNAQTFLGQEHYYDMTQYDETAICIPFVAGQTGVIKSWYFKHNSTSGTKSSYCIDTTVKHPRNDSCLSGHKNQNGDLGYPLANDEVSVTQGTTYYFCYEQHNDEGGEVDIETILVNNIYGGDLKGYYNTILPYNPLNRQFSSTTNPNIWVDYKSGGTWQGWSQSNYQASGVGYCYGYADDCYVVSPSTSIPLSTDISSLCAYDHFGTGNQKSGIKFTYPYDDNTIDKIKLMLFKGNATLPSQNFKILIQNTSPFNTLYTSSDISTSILFSKGDLYYHNNFTYFIHNVLGTVELKFNQTYYLFIQMSQYLPQAEGNIVCHAIVDYETGLFPDYITNYAGMRQLGGFFYSTNKEPFFVIEFDDDLDYTEPENETLYQCNDGIDNDLDGFTDYPNDPSCYGITDNDESPADYSEQDEDECLVALGCLIYESIPYSDSPFLHGWYGGQESDAKTIGHLGGYSIDLDTVDEFDIKENVIIFKDNQNINNYNELYGRFRLSILEEDTGSPIDNEFVYVGFLNEDDEGMAWIRINVSAETPYDLRLDIYAYDGNDWTFADYGWVDNADDGYLNIEFYLDEENNQYYLQITDFFGLHTTTATFDYDNLGSGSNQIAKAMVTNTIDRADGQVLLHLVELTGTDVEGETTICTTWNLPYHLKENFNGYMSQCDWNVYPEIFFYGKLLLDNEVDDFMLYKIFDYYEYDAMYYERSRYGTVKFDLKVYDDSESLTSVKVHLYDLALSNAFARLSFKTNGNIDASVDFSNTNLYDSLVTDEYKQVMIVVDLIDDEFDLYYDGILRAENIGFHDSGLNVDYFNGIYIESGNSHYEIDNLQVYESEDDGEESTAPINPVIIPDATKPFCKLFRTEQPTCNEDSDCDTDKCLVNGKCSRFDNTYCDDKGYTRGNLCIISGISYCALSSIGNAILKNFWLFLVLLILLMALIYLAVIFGKK